MTTSLLSTRHAGRGMTTSLLSTRHPGRGTTTSLLSTRRPGRGMTTSLLSTRHATHTEAHPTRSETTWLQSPTPSLVGVRSRKNSESPPRELGRPCGPAWCARGRPRPSRAGRRCRPRRSPGAAWGRGRRGCRSSRLPPIGRTGGSRDTSGEVHGSVGRPPIPTSLRGSPLEKRDVVVILYR